MILLQDTGGDEFLIILETGDRSGLTMAVQRIQAAVERFNADSCKPYRISLSMGYDVYDASSKMKPDDFFKHIDLLMYNDKRQQGE